MNTLKNIITILLISGISFSLSAQNNAIQNVQKLTISDGLAHNGVTCILEDSKGYIWFGTYEGLSLYDGYEFKTFKNSTDLNPLTSNRIRALSEDVNGDIWIGTDEGITIYNSKDNSFKKIYSNQNTSGPIVRNFFFNKKNHQTICGTEENGLLIFDETHALVAKKDTKSIHPSRKISFFNGINLNDEEYLFATNNGVLLYNSKSNSLKKILKDIGYTRTILKINNEKFLVAKLKGLVTIDYNVSQNSFSAINNLAFSNSQISTLSLDTDRNLWLGFLNNGLMKLPTPNFNQSLSKTKALKFKDNSNILRSSALYISSHNHCWYGTFNKGIYRFDLRQNGFNHCVAENNTKKGIQSNLVSFFTNYDKDRILLTENIGGISTFNTKTHTFENLPFSIDKTSQKNVRSIFKDSRQNIWYSFIGDTQLYLRKKGVANAEKIILNPIENVQIRSFNEDKYGNLWISTAWEEVYKLTLDSNNNTKNIEKLSTNLFFKNHKLGPIRCIYPDPNYDFVWIGSDSEGLFRLQNTQNSSLKNIEIDQFLFDPNKNSISSNFVTSVLRIPNNDLWIGTEGGGFCKVNNSDSKPTFLSITEKDGLSNNVVKNILFEGENVLWIPTNIGLSKYNIKEKKFRNFHRSDGLPFEDFWYTVSILKNGTFMLSGVNGLCYFKPSEISNNETLPKLQFDNFKVYHQNYIQNDTLVKTDFVFKKINPSKKIELTFDENIFSLDVTSLHFSNVKNHKIRYKLHPLNTNYLEVSSLKKTINYNGLRPGTYKLTAQASNSLNQWTDPKTLTIIITPPFWKTKSAYFLYILFSVIILIIIVKVILKIQSLRHKVEIEQLEIKKIQELNAAKLSFFSNVSHEIKTPITLISEPLKTIISQLKGNKELEMKLGLIQRQTKKILRLIDQVHDFQKGDANALKLHYTRFDFNSFINEVTQDFEQLAINEKKNFEVETSAKKIIVSADRDKLEKIFDNLLNNAFKFSEIGDNIRLTYSYNEKDLIISISDTGIGIKEEDLPHIFERFYRSQENIEGSGIGLAFTKQLIEMHYGYIEAFSHADEGTEIKLQLPIVKEILEIENIVIPKLPKEEEVVYPKKFFIDDATKSLINVSSEYANSLLFYVEDDYELRSYCTELLSTFFRVKSFGNGEECLKAMEDEWPDIIVSDIQMPKMNGLELCIQVKSDLKTSHIPVILLTALSKIENHIQGIRDGADAYIKKPFDAQHLIANIEALLANRKQLRERYKIGIPLTKENNQNNRNDNAFLEKLYKLIDKNIDNQNFDLNSLAKELYLNRTHFYQKVKVLTNQTPLELLRMYRLKRAADLLVHEKLTVNEVFLMTGFKSRPHFSKIFREKYGVSPGKYAKSLE
ncbi:hybrid sensor histidine kinase/response regulator transcription factor [Flavicella marina]|uniref:hybrid sensor histidine kinase/response regulator transcription factor n=1 Tax=Flavicella marina TaxID=1475951 RepID=UPI0012652212|nr:hybrid sensor histidine kinase/response regulator transcription factor [Flavicella marina]